MLDTHFLEHGEAAPRPQTECNQARLLFFWKNQELVALLGQMHCRALSGGGRDEVSV